MSHFAKVVNGVVTQVIVAEQSFFSTFIDHTGTWIQTSYNTRGGRHYNPTTGVDDTATMPALRGNYAGIGFVYDSVNDVFYPQKPYPSWTISAPTWTWTAPVPYPTDGKQYTWNESTLSWVLFTH